MKLFSLRRFFRRQEKPAHLASGEWGERQAARFLKRAGYRLLGRRVRPAPRLELDLIARKDDTLVFIEVKTRRNEDYGRPLAFVDRSKRKTLGRAATAYLRKLRKRPRYYRFDIIEVIGEPGAEPPEIRHIERAFTLPGDPRN